MGLERFVGKRGPFFHNGLLLAAAVGIHAHYALWRPDLAARNITTAAALLVISLQCARLLLVRVDPGMRTFTRFTGLVFSGFALVSAGRVILQVLGPGSDNDFFRSSSSHLLLIVAYQILLILLAYSLALMVNRRLLGDIRTQEEKFSKAFRSSPLAISLTRLSDGNIQEVNDAFLSLSGFRRDEVIGRTTADLELWADPRDRQSVVAALLRDGRVRELEHRFTTRSGRTLFILFSAEVIVIDGSPWVLSVLMDVTERKLAAEERERLLAEREASLSRIRQLSGLIPICSHCKKIRDDKGYWNRLEAYIEEHSEAEFSHGICRECAKKYYPDMDMDSEMDGSDEGKVTRRAPETPAKETP
jgi:PAS domain S-box-containing protein